MHARAAAKSAMSEDNNGDILIIEGITTSQAEGISVILIGRQIDRIRSGALQIADAAEILRGVSPTTAEIRAEWRRMKRNGNGT